MSNVLDKQKIDLSSASSIGSALDYFLDATTHKKIVLGDERYQPLFFDQEGNPFEYENIPDLERMKLVMNMGECTFGKSAIKYDYVRFSETLVFDAALQFPELKEKVVEVAKAIVSLSIEFNDTYDLWIDEFHTFGLHMLFVLALNDPTYIYLIAQYIIPYWDDEHAQTSFQQLLYFVSLYGYSNPHVLKAIANCYNDYQLMVLCSQELDCYEMEEESLLWKHCKANTKDFEYICSEFVKHIKAYPPHLSDVGEEESLADWFIHSIFGFYPGEEQGQTPYEDTVFETKFWELKKEVDAFMEGVERKNLYFRDRDDDDDDEDDDWDNIAHNREFFLKGFDNGETVLRYIETGANPEVLDTIEPCSLRQLCTDRNLSMLKRINYFGEELDEMIDHFFESYYEEDAHIEGMNYVVNGEDPSGVSQCLRMLDVLFRLRGKKPFDTYLTQRVCDYYKMISNEQFDSRYVDINDYDSYLKVVVSTLHPVWTDAMSIDNLERVYRLYKQSPDSWEKVLADLRLVKRDDIEQELLRYSMEMQNNSLAKGSELLSMAYICYKEGGLMAPQHLRPLIDYFNDRFWPLFEYHMFDDGFLYNMDEGIEERQKEVVAMIRSYCEGPKMPPPPPKAILMKLMTGGPDSLTPEEKEIFEAAKKEAMNQSKPADKEAVLEAIKEYCCSSENPRDIAHVAIFSEDEFSMLLSASLYSYNAFPGKVSAPFIRLVNLFVELAPVKTLHQLFKSFIPGRYFNRSYTTSHWVEFIDLLEKVKVPKKYILAWEIYETKYTLREDEEDRDTFFNTYKYLVEDFAYADKYEETSSFALAREKSRKEALKETISLLDLDTRREFLSQVNELVPCQQYLDIINEDMELDFANFVRGIILYDNPEWNRTDEEKEQVAKERAYFVDVIKRYIFETGDFSQIENELMPRTLEYIPGDIDTVIWTFTEEQRHRALYMLARLGHLNRLYDYLREWDEREDASMIDDFCDLLLKLELGRPFVVRFLVTYHLKSVNNGYEDNAFGGELNDRYPALHFIDDFSELTAKDISVLLKGIKKRVDLTSNVLQLLGSDNQRVQWDAADLIAADFDQRFAMYPHLFAEIIAENNDAKKEMLQRIVNNATPSHCVDKLKEMLS